MTPFTSNPYPTVGVEQEFHLIDTRTAELAPRIYELLDRLDDEFKKRIAVELMQCNIEHKSLVFRTVDEMIENAADARIHIDGVCRDMGMRIAAAGSHPFSDWRQIPTITSEHYRWVVNKCQYVSRRMLAFGFHVHVGMKSESHALYAMFEMLRWIYPLLGLSANSPFYENERTGLASTRSHIFGSMPTTQLPPYFESLDELDAQCDRLKTAGYILQPRDLWWVIRPQPPLGTVELRIFDMPTDLCRLAVLTAITQAALAWYQDQYEPGKKPAPLQRIYLEQNRWQAIRYGLDGDIVDPLTEEVISQRNQLHRLLDMIRPKARQLHCAHYLDLAEKMIAEGSEADWQIAHCGSLGGDLKKLQFEIAERTMQLSNSVECETIRNEGLS